MERERGGEERKEKMGRDKEGVKRRGGVERNELLGKEEEESGMMMMGAGHE